MVMSGDVEPRIRADELAAWATSRSGLEATLWGWIVGALAVANVVTLAAWVAGAQGGRAWFTASAVVSGVVVLALAAPGAKDSARGRGPGQ